MAIRRTTLTLAAALMFALTLGVQGASAATLLGSVDPSVSPEAVQRITANKAAASIQSVDSSGAY